MTYNFSVNDGAAANEEDNLFLLDVENDGNLTNGCITMPKDPQIWSTICEGIPVSYTHLTLPTTPYV